MALPGCAWWFSAITYYSLRRTKEELRQIRTADTRGHGTNVKAIWAVQLPTMMVSIAFMILASVAIFRTTPGAATLRGPIDQLAEARKQLRYAIAEIRSAKDDPAGPAQDKRHGRTISISSPIKRTRALIGLRRLLMLPMGVFKLPLQGLTPRFRSKRPRPPKIGIRRVDTLLSSQHEKG
jgi:hypothetical protein